MRCRKRPSAILFLDLVKAFDKGVREMLSGVSCESADVQPMLERLEIAPAVAAELAAFVIASKGMLMDLQLSARLVRLVSELHCGRGASSLCRPGCGRGHLGPSPCNLWNGNSSDPVP